jgi:hypothetical protein
MGRAIAVPFALVALACSSEGAPRQEHEHPDGTEWIFEGDEDARHERIARQLRGFDVAMAEVGYRYTELHWAGHDRNWGYAEYQLEKIRTAIANGLERRPRRAASAQMIDAPLASVERAIEARDPTAFDRELGVLTAACNACHQAEAVPFVTVVRPATRLSPVRGPAAAEAP